LIDQACFFETSPMISTNNYTGYFCKCQDNGSAAHTFLAQKTLFKICPKQKKWKMFFQKFFALSVDRKTRNVLE